MLLRSIVLVFLLTSGVSGFLFKLFGLGGRGYSYRGHRGMRHRRPMKSSSYLMLSAAHGGRPPSPSYGPPVSRPSNTYGAPTNVDISTGSRPIQTAAGQEYNTPTEEHTNDHSSSGGNSVQESYYSRQNNVVGGVVSSSSGSAPTPAVTDASYQQYSAVGGNSWQDNGAPIEENTGPSVQTQWQQGGVQTSALAYNDDYTSSSNNQIAVSENIGQYANQQLQLDQAGAISGGNINLVNDGTATYGEEPRVTDSQKYNIVTSSRTPPSSSSFTAPQSFTDTLSIDTPSYNSNIDLSDPVSVSGNANAVTDQDIIFSRDKPQQNYVDNSVLSGNNIEGASYAGGSNSAVSFGGNQNTYSDSGDQLLTPLTGGALLNEYSGGSTVIGVSTNIIDGGVNVVPSESVTGEFGQQSSSLNTGTQSLQEYLIPDVSQNFGVTQDQDRGTDTPQSSITGSTTSNFVSNDQYQSSGSNAVQTSYQDFSLSNNYGNSQYSDGNTANQLEQSDVQNSIDWSQFTPESADDAGENNNKLDLAFSSPQQQILVDLANSYNQNTLDWSQRYNSPI